MPPYNAKSWKQLVKNLSPKAKCGRPVTQARITAVEQALRVQFPQQLSELLREAGEVTDTYGHGPIWPLARIEQQNREFRTKTAFRELYMPFDHLLLFGAAVNRDHFAFAIQADGETHKNAIFIWDHETDGRSLYAAHLEQFLEKQLKRADDDDESES